MQRSPYNIRVLGGLAAVAAVAGTAAILAPATGADTAQPAPMPAPVLDPVPAAASIEAGRLPDGYRDWPLIAVAQEEGKLNDLRAVLGNDIAIKAAKAGAGAKQAYPEGSVIARLAWDHEALAESAAAFGSAQSYVAVHPKNGVQFMIKDAKKFAATGGWGYAQFNDRKLTIAPTDAQKTATCFACHQTVTSRDFVFNRYAP